MLDKAHDELGLGSCEGAGGGRIVCHPCCCRTCQQTQSLNGDDGMLTSSRGGEMFGFVIRFRTVEETNLSLSCEKMKGQRPEVKVVRER